MLKRKSGETWHIISPPPENVRGKRPPPNCAHASILSNFKVTLMLLQLGYDIKQKVNLFSVMTWKSSFSEVHLTFEIIFT